MSPLSKSQSPLPLLIFVVSTGDVSWAHGCCCCFETSEHRSQSRRGRLSHSPGGRPRLNCHAPGVGCFYDKGHLVEAAASTTFPQQYETLKRRICNIGSANFSLIGTTPHWPFRLSIAFPTRSSPVHALAILRRSRWLQPCRPLRRLPQGSDRCSLSSEE